MTKRIKRNLKPIGFYIWRLSLKQESDDDVLIFSELKIGESRRESQEKEISRWFEWTQLKKSVSGSHAQSSGVTKIVDINQSR